ncbi:MAG: hypothetical protein CMF49_08260 [Legionellales bacterium]|nr:hypothetical protein [Legionellales bacterium]
MQSSQYKLRAGVSIALAFITGAVLTKVVFDSPSEKISTTPKVHVKANHAQVFANIRKTLSGTSINKIALTPIEGIYEVDAGKNVFYVDKKVHYAFFGHLYDLVNNKDLTPAVTLKKASSSSANSPVIKWHDLPLDNAIITGNSKGIPIAVFVDPECPYCRKLESELLASNQFKVYQILLPLDSLHPSASQIANAIVCSADKNKAFTAWFEQGLVPHNNKDCSDVINANKAFAQANAINGTPVIIREDGAVTFGYRPVQQLLTWAQGGSDA